MGTECKKKLLPLPHLPSRLRLLLPQKGSTLYGLEVLSLPRSQPSNRCGSRNKNTTNPALELYTENASKLFFQFSNACQRRKHKIQLQICTFIINVIWMKRSFVSCSPNNDDYFLKNEILMFLTFLANLLLL